ncbi:ATPase/histidine kinase/DNA gyrase B/HSP90 domain protein [Flavobacterium daejeonense]|nr:ATPase/histidine kinase/DNA gyrase B/HSP90 domain protein [Flavobacterium daejeonense]
MKITLLKNYLIILFLLSLTKIAHSQENCSFENYLVEDGLPHNIINQVIQDKKGFIWLATTNGLSKYNGYTFQNFITTAKNKVLMKNNRINWIVEDYYGRIWMKAFANETKAYCFDPKTETFWGTELIQNIPDNNFEIKKIAPNKSGFVWLLSKNNGAILITDKNYSNKIYHTQKHTLNTNIINDVFEDRQKNSWLLTDKGIAAIGFHKTNEKPFYLIPKNNTSNAFYSAVELDDEIWFGGSNGIIIKYDKGTKNYRTQKLELNANVVKIEKLDKQRILAFTDQKGFCTINIFTGQIENYNSTNFPQLNTKNLSYVYLTKGQLLWFINKDNLGISLFNFKTKQLKYFSAKTDIFSATFGPTLPMVLTDSKGDVWVQPRGGNFSKYDPVKNELIPFTASSSYFPNGNFNNNFHIAFFDKQGNLWYNTQTNGVVKVVFSQANFKALHTHNPTIPTIRNDVRALFQDKNKNIWVATKQNQIIIYDKKLNRIGHLSPNGHLQNNVTWQKAVYNIMQDSQSNIWIGTRGNGIYKLTPKDQNYNFTVNHYTHNSTNPYSLSNDNIYSIFEDKTRKIWVGTWGGLNQISSINQSVRFINTNNQWKSDLLKKHINIRCISQDAKGLMYIGSTTGLLVLNPSKNLNSTENITIYEVTKSDKKSLNSNDVIDLCIAKNGKTFIATADGGISRVLTKNSLGYPLTFKNYTLKDGLPSNNILSMIEDNDGKLWITTDYILMRFNPADERFEVFTDVKPIMSYKNFTEATRVKLDSGELLFGYSEGFLHFFPDQIKPNNFKPYLALTALQLFNQPVAINETSPLKFTLDNSQNITLKHNQNFFNIQFAALDYINPRNIKYAYKLEGFDENWNYVHKQRTAFYTNVPKGTYTFKVKSTNSQGFWVNNQRSITIEVKPALWNTTVAYILYALLFIGIIYLINRTVLTIYSLKTAAKNEKEIFDLKQKFFIDISHELRTPLTLISGPIEYLINDNRTPEIIKKQLSFVAQSTNRLQRLVNQILDFRKIQYQKLKISEINLIEFVSDIFNNFFEIAQERNIKYQLEIEGEDIKLWADHSALEKIIMNLLSNAFKYTPDNKSITVSIKKTEKNIILTVVDEGIGISEEHQQSIFNRFASFNKNENNPSTGIGLALVKELVEKHQGELYFESQTNKGSTFSILFKTGNSHFTDDVEFISKEAIQDTEERNLIKTQPIALYKNQENSSEKIKVLIVEDDLKLLTFIKNILEEDYEILEAENGAIGYQKTLDNSPDFIISDIMMPVMDGVEFLKKIRTNIETSHIPVILLTAKTTIESKLEGLSYGADDYITKPFSVAYLKARIINLLEQRKRLQSIFDAYDKPENETKEYDPKPYLITDQDEQIMQKVMQIIEENMDNNGFSVEDLGTIIGLNRTSFNNKIKSLTGFTPVEFIRDIRIKRAAQLLTNSQLLIKEIAYMTGFSDIKYFSKTFKNKYGQTPSEYRNSKND